ncbi:unnamed protein product [Chrysoparadoxa australica]
MAAQGVRVTVLVHKGGSRVKDKQLTAMPELLFTSNDSVALKNLFTHRTKIGGTWTCGSGGTGGKSGYLIPISRYEEVLAQIKRGKDCVVKELPVFLLKLLKSDYMRVLHGEVAEDVDSLRDQKRVENIPEDLRKALYDFQMEAVVWAIQRGGRMLIGDEMGCGKTLEGIAIACCYRELWPVLIVVPANLRSNWQKELTKWVPGLRDGRVQVFKKGGEELSKRAEAVVVTYAMLPKLVEAQFKAVHFNLVICDESHMLKSPDAKRSKTCLPLIQQAKVAICMTGTPLMARPCEVFNQFAALLPDCVKEGDFIPFAKRYCGAYQGQFGWVTSGSSNTSELQLLLDETVMIRRLKQEVLKLPPKRREKIEIQVDPILLKEIKGMLAEYNELEKKQKGLGAATAEEEYQTLKMKQQALRTRLHSESGRAKLQGVVDHIKNLLKVKDGDRPVKKKSANSKGNGKGKKKNKSKRSENRTIDACFKGKAKPKTKAKSSAKTAAKGKRSQKPRNPGSLDSADEDEVKPSRKRKRRPIVVDSSSDEDLLLDSDVEVDKTNDEEFMPLKKCNYGGNVRSVREKIKEPEMISLVEEDSGPSWECSRCTFRNSLNATECKMCKSPREVKRGNNADAAQALKTVEGFKTICDLNCDLARSINTTESEVGLGKLVVFCHHKHVMKGIRDSLMNCGVEALCLDGSTAQNARGERVDQFQHDKDMRVMLISVTAASVGITLTAASHAVFAELMWAPGVLAQAEDRIHRIGQKAKDVIIQYLVNEETLDHMMLNSLGRKFVTLHETTRLNKDSSDFGDGDNRSRLPSSRQQNQQSIEESMRMPQLVMSSAASPPAPNQALPLSGLPSKLPPENSATNAPTSSTHINAKNARTIPQHSSVQPPPAGKATPSHQSMAGHSPSGTTLKAKQSNAPPFGQGKKQLDAEILARIEKNRLACLARRKLLEQQRAQGQPQPATSSRQNSGASMPVKVPETGSVGTSLHEKGLETRLGLRPGKGVKHGPQPEVAPVRVSIKGGVESSVDVATQKGEVRARSIQGPGPKDNNNSGVGGSQRQGPGAQVQSGLYPGASHEAGAWIGEGTSNKEPKYAKSNAVLGVRGKGKAAPMPLKACPKPCPSVHATTPSVGPKPFPFVRAGPTVPPSGGE